MTWTFRAAFSPSVTFERCDSHREPVLYGSALNFFDADVKGSCPACLIADEIDRQADSDAYHQLEQE